MHARLKRQYTVVLTGPSEWRIVPSIYRREDQWPRLFQFGWLCFFFQVETKPA